MVQHAASQSTRKQRKNIPLPDAQRQAGSRNLIPARETLVSGCSLDDRIKNTAEIEAATAVEQPDTDMLQAGLSRDPRKGKAQLTPEQLDELDEAARATFNSELNSRIKQYGQNSSQVKAYLWSQRRGLPEADYQSSEDSERGHSNTDADAEYAALLQAEETAQNRQQQAQAPDSEVSLQLRPTSLSCKLTWTMKVP